MADGVRHVVVVTGGRDARDSEPTFRALDAVQAEKPITLIVEGGNRQYEGDPIVCVGGVDYFAKCWARSKGVNCHTEKADWNKYGRAAGPIRNGWMLAHNKPDLVVALPGGKGTADCVKQAREMNIPVREVGG